MNEEQVHLLRDNILTETASGVGFRYEVVGAIVQQYPAIIAEVLKQDAGEWLLTEARKGDNANVLNLFVTEAVRLMDYEEFQAVAKYFFGYVQTEEEYLAEPVEITRSEFQKINEERLELWQLKNPVKDLLERYESQKYASVETDRYVLAYDPIRQTMAVLEGRDYYVEPYLEEYEGLMVDYTSSRSIVEQLVSYLSEQTSPEFQEAMVERFDTNTREFYDEYMADGNSYSDWNWCMEVYLKDGIQRKLAEINHVLSENENAEILSYTAIGYSQGEVWDLYYFWDKEQEPELTIEEVEDFLDHTVGAYYRGSLTELKIYDEEEEVVDSYLIDREHFWDDSIETVRELTQVETYIDIESAVKMDKQGLQLSKEKLIEWNQLSAEERRMELNTRIDQQVRQRL